MASGKTGRAVTAHAVAVKGVKPEVHVLVDHGDTGVRSDSAAVPRGVVRPRSRHWRPVQSGRTNREIHARINAVAEPAEDTEDFDMAETRINGRLDDDVRHGVEGIVGALVECMIERVAAGGGRQVPAEGKVVGLVRQHAAKDRLRIFQRCAEPEFDC